MIWMTIGWEIPWDGMVSQLLWMTESPNDGSLTEAPKKANRFVYDSHFWEFFGCWLQILQVEEI